MVDKKTLYPYNSTIIKFIAYLTSHHFSGFLMIKTKDTNYYMVDALWVNHYYFFTIAEFAFLL